ncbi:MAG TPA: hypothetical protein VI855_06125 [Dehalococcoidia bacterium]|nr:hypothetical protein [Dehalococcoidia bacterium]
MPGKRLRSRWWQRFAAPARPFSPGAGQQQGRQLARQAALRVKQVAVLPLSAYGGHKDASAA